MGEKGIIVSFRLNGEALRAFNERVASCPAIKPNELARKALVEWLEKDGFQLAASQVNQAVADLKAFKLSVRANFRDAIREAAPVLLEDSRDLYDKCDRMVESNDDAIKALMQSNQMLATELLRVRGELITTNKTLKELADGQR